MFTFFFFKYLWYYVVDQKQLLINFESILPLGAKQLHAFVKLTHTLEKKKSFMKLLSITLAYMKSGSAQIGERD